MKKLLLSLIIISSFGITLSQQFGNKHSLSIPISAYSSDSQAPSRQTATLLVIDQPFSRGYHLHGEPSLAYSAGFTHSYRIFPWLKWETGLSFSATNYKYWGEAFFPDEFPIGQTDVEVWNLVKSVEGNNHIYFLEVQFGPQISTGGQRMRVFLRPYFEFNYYLSDRRTETIIYQDGFTVDNPTARDTTTMFRNFYTAFGLGLGPELRVSQKIDFSLMVFLEGFFQPIDDYEVMDGQIKPMNGGVTLKVNYQL